MYPLRPRDFPIVTEGGSQGEGGCRIPGKEVENRPPEGPGRRYPPLQEGGEKGRNSASCRVRRLRTFFVPARGVFFRKKSKRRRFRRRGKAPGKGGGGGCSSLIGLDRADKNVPLSRLDKAGRGGIMEIRRALPISGWPSA